MATSAPGKWTEEQETSTQDVGCMYKKQGKLRLPPHDKNGIDSIDPEDSVSQVSHLSRTSRGSSVRASASLIRFQEEQRQTELMARADAAKEYDTNTNWRWRGGKLKCSFAKLRKSTN